MDAKKVNIKVIFAILALLIVGMYALIKIQLTDFVPEPRKAPIGSNIEISQLELQPDWKFTRGEYGNTFITGVVKNTGKAVSYAQITFTLLDKSNNQVGTALANINNLEANGKWKFRAICLNEDVSSAKLDKLAYR